MPLRPGTTLGPYEILSPSGAGGMGEVYKARDTRLDRTVAIKVLPEHVASDPDLKQRFEREAKTISSLNHPHICTLHDIGSQDGAWTAKMSPRPEPRGTTMRGMMLAVLSVALLSGCATKGFVTERVDDRAAEVEAEVDARIAALQRALDESETTIQRQEARLREVDETANNAFALATSAGAAAGVAQTTADNVGARANTIDRASLRLVFEVVIADSHDQFTFADATLPDSARGTLDRFVEQLRQLPTASYLDIEGHTDATGPAAYNARLGLERAENVRRYLHEQHQLPLHKMSVISYGEDQPVASNDDRDGRAKNRRVVVRVLG